MVFFSAFWPVEFGVVISQVFAGFLVTHPFLGSRWFFAMECVKTCVIHASELVASYEKTRVMELLRECLDFEELSAIQFCPRGLIRVTFKDAADKEDFVRVGSLTLDGHVLSVTSSDKPHSFVYVHYFPVEGDDALIREELGKYGEVVSLKHQSFAGIPGLLTGSRVLTMVLSDPVPAEFRINDYPVRVWYKGIPPFCQICKISGHKAADCQFNGKCRRCGSPDHKAHACTRPWGQSAVPMEVAVPVVPVPPETVVPDETVADAASDEVVDVSTPVGVPVPSPLGCVSGPAPSVPVTVSEPPSVSDVTPGTSGCSVSVTESVDNELVNNEIIDNDLVEINESNLVKDIGSNNSQSESDSLDQLLAAAFKRSKRSIVPSVAVSAAAIVKRSKAVPGARAQKKFR